MNTITAAPAGSGLNILIIHAPGCPPAQDAIGKLLADAGLAGASITLATPADIAGGKVNPKDFDHVIAVLDDGLAKDDQLDASMLGVARCGMGVTGIWAEGSETDDMHPALRKYGAKQVPWNAAELAKTLGSEPAQTFQSSTGGTAARHDTTHNKC